MLVAELVVVDGGGGAEGVVEVGGRHCMLVELVGLVFVKTKLVCMDTKFGTW